MARRRSQPLAWLLLALVVLWAARAPAAPPSGQATPVTVEDTTGARHPVPDLKLPVLVIYEDQNAGKQNGRARDEVGRITDKPENRGRLLLMAVADLEKWNWWPAKKYALQDLQKIAKKEDTTLYCDWTGGMRKSWRLQKGKSGFILVASDGKIHFAAEGPLSDAQLKELVAQLAALGISI